MPDFIALLSRMLCALIYALAIGWKLTLIFLPVVPVIFFLFNLMIKVIVTYTIKETQAYASASSIAQEVLQNIRTVTSFHGQQKDEERCDVTSNLKCVMQVTIFHLDLPRI